MNEQGRTIDEVLRDIAMPVELPRSVRPEALFADDQLDRLLAGVVVPADLAERVHARVGTRIPRRRNGAIDLTRFTRDHEAASEANGPRPAPVTVSEPRGACLAWPARRPPWPWPWAWRA